MLTAITLTTIAVSVVVHGITVTPLMAWYENRSDRSTDPDAAGPAEEPEPAS